MALVIEGIEMPKKCKDCPMAVSRIYGHHFVSLCNCLNEEFEDKESRPKDCPIKGEIPDKHGRLISGIIDKTPTVLEATE